MLSHRSLLIFLFLSLITSSLALSLRQANLLAQPIAQVTDLTNTIQSVLTPGTANGISQGIANQMPLMPTIDFQGVSLYDGSEDNRVFNTFSQGVEKSVKGTEKPLETIIVFDEDCLEEPEEICIEECCEPEERCSEGGWDGCHETKSYYYESKRWPKKSKSCKYCKSSSSGFYISVEVSNSHHESSDSDSWSYSTSSSSSWCDGSIYESEVCKTEICKLETCNEAACTDGSEYFEWSKEEEMPKAEKDRGQEEKFMPRDGLNEQLTEETKPITPLIQASLGFPAIMMR